MRQHSLMMRVGRVVLIAWKDEGGGAEEEEEGERVRRSSGWMW